MGRRESAKTRVRRVRPPLFSRLPGVPVCRWCWTLPSVRRVVFRPVLRCGCVVFLFALHVADFGIQRSIYLIGNPVVVWGTSMSILMWLITGGMAMHFRVAFTYRPKDVRAFQLCRCGTARLRHVGGVTTCR